MSGSVTGDDVPTIAVSTGSTPPTDSGTLEMIKDALRDRTSPSQLTVSQATKVRRDLFERVTKSRKYDSSRVVEADDSTKRKAVTANQLALFRALAGEVQGYGKTVFDRVIKTITAMTEYLETPSIFNDQMLSPLTGTLATIAISPDFVRMVEMAGKSPKDGTMAAVARVETEINGFRSNHIVKSVGRGDDRVFHVSLHYARPTMTLRNVDIHHESGHRCIYLPNLDPFRELTDHAWLRIESRETHDLVVTSSLVGAYPSFEKAAMRAECVGIPTIPLMEHPGVIKLVVADFEAPDKGFSGVPIVASSKPRTPEEIRNVYRLLPAAEEEASLLAPLSTSVSGLLKSELETLERNSARAMGDGKRQPLMYCGHWYVEDPGRSEMENVALPLAGSYGDLALAFGEAERAIMSDVSEGTQYLQVLIATLMLAPALSGGLNSVPSRSVKDLKRALALVHAGQVVVHPKVLRLVRASRNREFTDEEFCGEGTDMELVMSTIAEKRVADMVKASSIGKTVGIESSMRGSEASAPWQRDESFNLLLMLPSRNPGMSWYAPNLYHLQRSAHVMLVVLTSAVPTMLFSDNLSGRGYVGNTKLSYDEANSAMGEVTFELCTALCTRNDRGIRELTKLCELLERHNGCYTQNFPTVQSWNYEQKLNNIAELQLDVTGPTTDIGNEVYSDELVGSSEDFASAEEAVKETLPRLVELWHSLRPNFSIESLKDRHVRYAMFADRAAGFFAVSALLRRLPIGFQPDTSRVNTASGATALFVTRCGYSAAYAAELYSSQVTQLNVGPSDFRAFTAASKATSSGAGNKVRFKFPSKKVSFGGNTVRLANVSDNSKSAILPFAYGYFGEAFTYSGQLSPENPGGEGSRADPGKRRRRIFVVPTSLILYERGTYDAIARYEYQRESFANMHTKAVTSTMDILAQCLLKGDFVIMNDGQKWDTHMNKAMQALYMGLVPAMKNLSKSSDLREQREARATLLTFGRYARNVVMTNKIGQLHIPGGGQKMLSGLLITSAYNSLINDIQMNLIAKLLTDISGPLTSGVNAKRWLTNNLPNGLARNETLVETLASLPASPADMVESRVFGDDQVGSLALRSELSREEIFKSLTATMRATAAIRNAVGTAMGPGDAGLSQYRAEFLRKTFPPLVSRARMAFTSERKGPKPKPSELATSIADGVNAHVSGPGSEVQRLVGIIATANRVVFGGKATTTLPEHVFNPGGLNPLPVGTPQIAAVCFPDMFRTKPGVAPSVFVEKTASESGSTSVGEAIWLSSNHTVEVAGVEVDIKQAITRTLNTFSSVTQRQALDRIAIPEKFRRWRYSASALKAVTDSLTSKPPGMLARLAEAPVIMEEKEAVPLSFSGAGGLVYQISNEVTHAIVTDGLGSVLLMDVRTNPPTMVDSERLLSCPFRSSDINELCMCVFGVMAQNPKVDHVGSIKDMSIPRPDPDFSIESLKGPVLQLLREDRSQVSARRFLSAAGVTSPDEAIRAIKEAAVLDLTPESQESFTRVLPAAPLGSRLLKTLLVAVPPKGDDDPEGRINAMLHNELLINVAHTETYGRLYHMFMNDPDRPFFTSLFTERHVVGFVRGITT